MQVKQKVYFTAVAYDSDNEPLSGIDFEWTVTDTGRSLLEKSFNNPVFETPLTGIFTVKVRAGNKFAQRTLVVNPLQFPQPPNLPVRELSSVTGMAPSEDPPPPDPATPDNWNSNNWIYADDPDNQTGNPPGSPADDGAGSGNFQLSAPILSLPGRGIDLALNLNYNSRVWNKSNNQINFDLDYGWPAPGWSLGFGKIMFMGSNGGCMLVDADGTRHGYTGSIQNWSNGMSFNGHTADGSFIDYGCHFNYGSYGTGWAKLPNGTQINYTTTRHGNSHVQPTRITDAQGNFITITYRNDADIETITDTLGRVITFQYDSLNRLISVKAPKYGGKTRTLVRLHYKPITLNYSFAYGTTPIVRNNTPYVIDSIYYPATNTGYWFNDSDSYSSYGMITKVVEMRGMSWATGSEEQGVINAGSFTKQAVYNYPLTTANETGRTNGLNLSDAPTYEKLTENWDWADVSEPTVTTYSINRSGYHHDGTSNSPARISTITHPNGVISKQYSYRTPGTWTDGLIFADETVVMNGTTETLVGSSLVSWAQGDYDTPRIGWAEIKDENGYKIRTEYDYSGGRFNQITRSCDYGNGGYSEKLRCTVAQYENSQAYVGSHWNNMHFGNHVLNLVKATGVENPDGTFASWTEYEYDNYQSQPLANTPGVIQHDFRFDPYTTQTQDGECAQWQCGEINCGGTQPPDPAWYCVYYHQVSAYDGSTASRGNITKVTGYADAQNRTGAASETRGYDITGNLVKSSVASNEQKSIVFDDPNTSYIDTQYAYPISETRGASDAGSPHRITTSSIYDYNTGSVLSMTDANGRTSTTAHSPNSLRPERATSSTGAYTSFSYDDAAMTVTETLTESNGALAGQTKKYLNGFGQVRKEESYGPNNVIDIVENKYTKFGEEWKHSRPYRAGETVYWSEKFYDSQRRLTKIVEPDGSETRTFYNETSLPDSTTALASSRVRVVDAWGRERWARYDQQGRLVEMVEPSPNGNGSVFSPGSLVTKYKYDSLGRLTETEQGNQSRYFKYDSLGRLTRQKLAEQTATLNDSGQYVGANQSGAIWSSAFFYDGRSNLVQKTDARGVRTYYSFQIGGTDDPLNRLHRASYDVSGPLEPGVTIHTASASNYEYMTSGDKTRVRRIATEGLSVEDFVYDAEGRVSDYTQTVEYRWSYPMTTSYLYDSLDRVKETRYPVQYGLPGSPRKLIVNSYDTTSRLTAMSVDGQQAAGDIVYNASDQTTSIKIGAPNPSQVTENYTFDPQTGYLSNQNVIRKGISLLNLTYEYSRLNSPGSLNGKTGQVTKIVNNLDYNKNREYEFDVLGRLTRAKGGYEGGLWNQNYTYDRYGNRTNVTASGMAADGSPIPRDGIPNLTYNNTSNRVSTAGFEYDSAGNQTRTLADDGVTWLRYEYDSANRIRLVKRDDAGQTPLQTFQYASTNARLMAFDHGTNQWMIYASLDGVVMAEYTEFSHTVQTWTKSYTYLGDKPLSTITPNGQGGENTEYSHPDKLGTRLITNQATGTSFEQVHLPFGRPLDAESSITNNNKRFTSYDRSARTGLDYAINRTYDSKLGRFSQVDPIEMGSVDINRPQTLNLYSYCGNDPVNHVDPDGLFFGKLFKWIGKLLKKAFKWIAVAIAVAIAVLTIIYAPILFSTSLKLIFGIIGAVANAAQSVLSAFGLNRAAQIFGIISGFASFGTSFLNARSVLNWKTFLAAVSSAATATARTLSYLGHTKLGQIFGFVSTVTGFISQGLQVTGNKASGFKYSFRASYWDIYKFARSSAEQIANIAGARRVAGFLNVAGIIDNVGDIYRTLRALRADLRQIRQGRPGNLLGPPNTVERLIFLTNQRITLTGSDLTNAQFIIFIRNLLNVFGQQAGRINSIISRVERGVALAR